MRITRTSVDELNTILTDLIDGAGQAIRDAADVWLDEEAERDERADARETLDSEIEDLRTQIGDLARLLNVEI
jgi:gas vesicle protein